VDAMVHENAVVQPFYDSLVAKLIVTAADRELAIARTLRAIDEFVIEGITTTLPLQRALLESEEFISVDFHTRFIDGWLKRRAAEMENENSEPSQSS